MDFGRVIGLNSTPRHCPGSDWEWFLWLVARPPPFSFVTFWGYYTELCTWGVLFAAGSGLYLWVSSRREKVTGAMTLATALAASLFFIFYVMLRG